MAETNLIHLDVLTRVVQAPLAICDLSSRNPNVLFELGLRHAFDKPVVLVQEDGTPSIFDVNILRYTTYRAARIYHEVLEDRERLSVAIAATALACKNNEGVNSVVRLLSLQAASLANAASGDIDPSVQLLRAEIASLRSELRVMLPRADGGRTAAFRLFDERMRDASPNTVALFGSVWEAMRSRGDAWTRADYISELCKYPFAETLAALRSLENWGMVHRMELDGQQMFRLPPPEGRITEGPFEPPF